MNCILVLLFPLHLNLSLEGLKEKVGGKGF